MEKQLNQSIAGNQAPQEVQNPAENISAVGEVAPKVATIPPAQSLTPEEKAEKRKKRQSQREGDRQKFGRGFRGWLNKKLSQLEENTDLVTLYARQKDYKYFFELIGPFVGEMISRGATVGRKPKDGLKDILADVNKHRSDAIQDLSSTKQSASDLENSLGSVNSLNSIKPKFRGLLGSLERLTNSLGSFLSSEKDYHDTKALTSPNYKIKRLNINLAGDLLNFTLNFLLSGFSSWTEKRTVVRTYSKLVEEELQLSGNATFSDLKRSKNPIVQEAVRYYSRKSIYRYLPDFTGLVRLIPRIYFGIQRAKHGGREGWGKNYEGKQLDNFMWNIAENLDGMKLLLGTKTAFYSWYFFKRQKGSFYEAQDIWDKTEAVKIYSDRPFVKQRLANEFVTQQDITRLYLAYRKENPEKQLADFTPDDPLSNRVFEQIARYMNHTYRRKLFAINEPKKQVDLPRKRLSHAMLIDLLGNGGLNVNQALTSALRLEVMAYGGSQDVREGEVNMQKGIELFRDVTEKLEGIYHPNRKDYGNFDNPEELQRAVNDVRQYFEKIEELGKHYLGDAWPPYYISRELRPLYIQHLFKGTTLSIENFRHITSALADVSPDHEFEVYMNAPYPASVLFAGAELADGRKGADGRNYRTASALQLDASNGISYETSVPKPKTYEPSDAMKDSPVLENKTENDVSDAKEASELDKTNPEPDVPSHIEPQIRKLNPHIPSEPRSFMDHAARKSSEQLTPAA